MKLILPPGIDSVEGLVTRQLTNLFGFDAESETEALQRGIEVALSRMEECVGECAHKYFVTESGDAKFDLLHSAQYMTFLYYVSHAVSVHDAGSPLAAKLYYLNKSLNACDLYHAIELPDIFFAEHPVGSVMGRAKYGNYFVFQQGCTIGGNKGCYPTLGEYVWMFANSTVIGNCRIGNNVFLAAGSFVKDTDIPDNTIVFGQSPNLTLKQKSAEFFFERSLFHKHQKQLCEKKRAA